MPVIPEARRYTVAEVMAFPDDGNRYEVVHGELLVTPAPRATHQGVVTEVTIRLASYLATLGRTAIVRTGPAAITWDSDDIYVEPDVFVVPLEEATADWRTYKTLLLVVEVLSPSNLRGDRVVKRRLYQEQQVGTYWVVDADKRIVEVWRPGDEVPELVTDILRWRLTTDGPELGIVLSELWAAAVPR